VFHISIFEESLDPIVFKDFIVEADNSCFDIYLSTDSFVDRFNWAFTLSSALSRLLVLCAACILLENIESSTCSCYTTYSENDSFVVLNLLSKTHLFLFVGEVVFFSLIKR